MKSGIWTVIAVATWTLGFWGGYAVSTSTGSEPGYFNAVEAAGYGGGEEKIEGVSTEVQDYYKNLRSAE